MLQKLKHTVKHSLIYSLGNLSVKIIGLILLPLYTDYFQTDELGKLYLLSITAQLLVPIFILGLNNALMRWWVDAKSEKEKKIIISSVLFVLITISIILNLILQPFSKDFSILLFKTASYTDVFTILFISISFEILNIFLLSLIRVTEKSFFYIIISSVKFAVILTLTILLIVKYDWGIKGVFFSQMIGHILIILIAIPYIIKNITFKIDFLVIKKMLSYSIPLLFTAISGIILTFGDRYILKFIMGDSAVAIYSLAFSVAGLVNFFIFRSFQMGFLPIAYKIYNKPNAKRFFSKVTLYLTAVLSITVLGLSLFSKEMLMLFSPTNSEYWSAYLYVPLIGLLTILNGIKYMFGIKFHLVKKTKIIALSISLGAVLNIILNIIFIPIFQIYGVIISSIISVIVVSIIYYFFSQKYYPINYSFNKIIKLFLVGIVLFLISLLTNNINIILAIFIKTVLLALFPIVLYFLKFYEEIELLRVKQAFHKWKNPNKWKENLNKLGKKE